MKIKRLVLDAIFAALAIILYCFVKFPLPMIFPGFLEFNFSMLPILICLFMLSSKDALIVAILRIVGKLLFMNSTTMYVGELADLLMSLIIIFGTLLTIKISRRNIFLLVGIIISWIIAGILTNVLINIPLYIKLMGLTLEQLSNMCAIIPGITPDNFMFKYLLYAVIPFNLILAFGVGLITVLVYKRLSRIYDKL